MLYRVTWEIDVDAESPREAAMQAMQIMPTISNPESTATEFRVCPYNTGYWKYPEIGNSLQIDLAEPENKD